MSLEPFRRSADLEPALRRVAEDGAAHVPRLLSEPFRRRLQEEIEWLPMEPAPETVGQVRQETETWDLPAGKAPPPAVAALRRSLVRVVRASGVRGLRTWRPNDVVVQRYLPGSVGITSHRDGKRFRRLVAVFTTAGEAEFAIRRERHGEIVGRWTAGPGSLTLLRGPGLAGARDGRPFHEVSGPRQGVRYSVGFRMEARP